MDKAEAILKKLFGRYSDRDDEGLIGFFSQWQGLVGTDLAAHADPVDIKHGTLYLEVDHPAWLQRLHAKQGEILKAIQGRFPNLEIEQIFFRMTSDQLAGSDKSGARGTAAAERARDRTATSGDKPRDRAAASGARPSAVKTTGREAPTPGSDTKAPSTDPQAPESTTDAEALKKLPDSKLKKSLERLRRHLEPEE